MSELGNTLKDARLKKGLQLEDIQNITKIQKRYLEAIEEGNLEILPGHFYARAFVKSYAEAVGLDPDVVLEQIKDTPFAQPQMEEPKVPLRRMKQEKTLFQPSKWLSRVLLGLFAALIICVIVIGVGQLSKSQSDGESAQQPQGVVDDDQTEPNNPEQPSQEPEETPEPEASNKPVLSYLAREGNAYKYELTGVEQIELSMTASERCWFSLSKDGQNGEKVESVEMAAGSVKQWTMSGTSAAWLRIGAPQNVKIEVNGQALDTSIMGSSAQNISIILKQ
ncbi:helix-turn-helix domain-containing protein [Ammoniphilus oxalaticus]|nr:helix-turn-helix domain-containing protein [Ammoniphilus oxalaticus]